MDIVEIILNEYLNDVNNDSESSKILEELDEIEREMFENVDFKQKENLIKISELIDKLIIEQGREIVVFVIKYIKKLSDDLLGIRGDGGKY